VKDFHLSKSAILQFYGCPFCYEQERILKVPTPAGEARDRGIAVHAAVAAYARHCIENKVQSDVYAIEKIIARVFEKMVLSPEVYEEADKIVRDFGSDNIFFPDRIFAVEKYMETMVGKYKYVGYLDLGEYLKESRTIQVTDYKTSHQVAKKVEVKNSLELGGYALLAWREVYPKALNVVKRLNFVRTGYIVEAEYGIADLAEIESRIIAAGDMITQAIDYNKFPATPGSYCRWCPYPHLCPHKERGIPERVDSNEAAILVVQDLLAEEIKKKAKQEALRPWCVENGLVRVNGEDYGFHNENTNTYDKTELVEWLLKRGGVEQVVKYMKPNSQALKTWKEELIGEAILVPGIKTKFTHKKAIEGVPQKKQRRKKL
jgi:RecB family exonuclease